MMNQDPHVKACVMFGRGRLQAGILVEPKPEYSFDPSNEAKLAEFRNKVWCVCEKELRCRIPWLIDVRRPTVVKMNAFAPQHSRLFKEVIMASDWAVCPINYWLILVQMILVAKISKPFSYTAKHTVRRGIVVKDYEDEINALYASVDESSQSTVPPPMSWDVTSAAGFVRKVVEQVMGRTITDDSDLFQNGCDRRVLLRRATTYVDTYATVCKQPTSETRSYAPSVRRRRSIHDTSPKASSTTTRRSRCLPPSFHRSHLALTTRKTARTPPHPGSKLCVRWSRSTLPTSLCIAPTQVSSDPKGTSCW